jgi:iron complex outermembrane receptor protein
LSAYLENHYTFNKLNISTSLMANWNSMFGLNVYPGIDFLYHVGKNWSTLASFNISGRLPSFTDLYYVGAGNQGNIELTPEKSINYEIGAKFINSLFNLQSSIFYRQGIDIIDWIKADASQLWQSANITIVNTIGYEIIAKFSFIEKYGDHFPVSSINLAYTYLDMRKNSDEYISKYVLDYLRHNANFVLNHKITSNFTASWMLNLQFRNGNYIPYNHSTLSWEPATSYLPLYLLDLKLNYQIKYIDLFIQGKNILNQDHQNIENVQLPGRWISGGIIINLKFK